MASNLFFSTLLRTEIAVLVFGVEDGVYKVKNTDSNDELKNNENQRTVSQNH